MEYAGSVRAVGTQAALGKGRFEVKHISPMRMTMKKTALLSLLTAAMLPLAASDGTALFRRIDANKDLQISQAEARPHGLTAAVITGHDHNGDGKINESEFLVAYAKMAEANGSAVARDLAKQVARIEAAQIAAAKEAAKLKEQRAKYNRRIGATKELDSANQRAQAKRRQEVAEAARKQAAEAARKEAKRQAEAKRKKSERDRPLKRPEAKRPNRRNP